MIKVSARAIYEDLALKAKGPKKLLPPETREVSRNRILNLINANPVARKVSYGAAYGGGFQGQQNSIAKISYLTNRHEKQWKAHGKYLAREGAQQVGDKGIGFNELSDSIDIAQELDSWQKAGDELLWKVIISPEQGAKLDLKEHVKELMKQVEIDLNTQIQYVACDHYNTDQPHVHVAMRGVRADGKVLEIDKAYLAVGVRTRSKEIATRTLGLRLEKDVLLRREQAISKRYVTELDREIQRRMDEYRTISFDQRPVTGFKHEKEIQLVGRLQYLSKIGLAKKEDAITWKINEHHLDYLKRVQLQDDIIKSQNRHRDTILDQDLPVISNELSNKGEMVLGRLVGTGVMETNEDRRYILVEGVDKNIHYVGVTPAVLELLDTKKLKNGDIVYLERKERERSGPIKVSKFDFNRVGPKGLVIYEMLVNKGLLISQEGSEGTLVQNMGAVQQVVSELYPEQKEPIRSVLEEVKKMRSLDVQVIENFENMRHEKGVQLIDRYILSIFEKSQGQILGGIDDSIVRKQMLDIAPDRVKQLRQLRVIKEDLSIDRDRLERLTALEKRRLREGRVQLARGQ